MIETKFCFKCGSKIDKEAVICVKCGVMQPSTGANKICGKGKNKLTAGLLGILLGGFGIHKFYLGSSGLGILYILFSWTGISVIIGIIEGIIYLCMTDEEFNSKYN